MGNILQASAGAYALSPGGAGLIDARGMTVLTGAVNPGAGSSTGALQITRVLSIAATSHNSSTAMQAMLLAGLATGTISSTGVDWPFYWVSFNSTSTGGTTTASVALV